MNIAFIGYGMLGDFVVCHRSIELLKARYPDSIIFYLGDKIFAEIGKHFGVLDEIVDDYDLNYILSRDVKLVINHRMDNGMKFANKMQQMGFLWLRERKQVNFQNTKIFLQENVVDTTRCAAAQVGELVELLDITTDNWYSTFTVYEEQLINAMSKYDLKFDKPFIAWHPGSSSVGKNYPLQKWLEVIKPIIKEQCYRLIVFSGSSEMNTVLNIKEKLKDSDVFFAANFPLSDAIPILSKCKIFLGHDTGFAHIAAALKIQSLLLFGPSSSVQIWAPPAPWSHVISNSLDISNIEINAIKTKIYELL